MNTVELVGGCGVLNLGTESPARHREITLQGGEGDKRKSNLQIYYTVHYLHDECFVK